VLQVACLALPLLAAEVASAGGLFLPGRGVRALGRGGAFTAGADDLNALWYNPAGLTYATDTTDEWGWEGFDSTYNPEQQTYGNRAALIDFALTGQIVNYSRVDSGGNPLPQVSNGGVPLPVPTLAYGQKLGGGVSIAGGVFTPDGGIPDYPEGGPQRYSLVSLVGSVFVIPEVGLAWSPPSESALSVGVGVQDLITKFDARVDASGCPGKPVCAPEDPDFDAPTEMTMTSLFNPSANAGVIVKVPQSVFPIQFGATLQLPFSVSGNGKARVRLPPSAFYNGAMVQGDDIHVHFVIPMMARVGVEIHNGSLTNGPNIGPKFPWRLELEGDWEKWSSQDKIQVTPQNIAITGVPGIGTYTLGPLDIVRGFRDTYAVHLGGETLPFHMPLWLRAGYTFERGASTAEYLNVATVDTNKHGFSVGAGWVFGHSDKNLTLDAVLAYFYQPTMNVTDSLSLQVNPVRGSQPVAVGNGTYKAGYWVAGLGVSSRF
jgi:long-chain fatty acid transport protein